jgi:hypothetical protein
LRAITEAVAGPKEALDGTRMKLLVWVWWRRTRVKEPQRSGIVK